MGRSSITMTRPACRSSVGIVIIGCIATPGRPACRSSVGIVIIGCITISGRPACGSPIGIVIISCITISGRPAGRSSIGIIMISGVPRKRTQGCSKKQHHRQNTFHFQSFLFLNLSYPCYGRITPSQSRPRIIIYSSITPPFCKKNSRDNSKDWIITAVEYTRIVCLKK